MRKKNPIIKNKGIAPLIIAIVVIVAAVAIAGGVYVVTRSSSGTGGTSGENLTPEQTFTIYSVEASTVTVDGWHCLRTLIDGKTEGITYFSMQLPSEQWAYAFWNLDHTTGVAYYTFDGIDHIQIQPFDGTKVVDVFALPKGSLPGQPPENGTYTAVIRTMDNIIYRKSLIISWS